MDARPGWKLTDPFDLLVPSFKMTMLGIVIIGSLFFVNQLKLSTLFPIKTVRIYGANHLDQQEVKNLLLPFIKRGFFAVKVENIRDNLLQLPWISDVSVRRLWPDKLDVSISEKIPAATWNDKELLSTVGEIFLPKKDSFPRQLPSLIGPEGKQVEVLDQFTELKGVFDKINVSVSYLELTPYYTWKIKLSNGILLQVGRKDILTRLKHFVKVYPKIIGNDANDVEYVDLRYSNGVAVRWKG